MDGSKAEIIERLQKEILPLQGFGSNPAPTLIPNLGVIDQAFANNRFAVGAIHEFISITPEDAAAAAGFIGGILSFLMQEEGTCLWIGMSRTVFPPALATFGIKPDNVIFVTLPTEKEVTWAIEEALKCRAVGAVVGELKHLDFTVSRRFQLAVEQSGVTGFILRRGQLKMQTNACVTRWRISSNAGIVPDALPGVGHPSWYVELLKVRNGRPGAWKMAWINNSFEHISEIVPAIRELKKKTG